MMAPFVPGDRVVWLRPTRRRKGFTTTVPAVVLDVTGDGKWVRIAWALPGYDVPATRLVKVEQLRPAPLMVDHRDGDPRNQALDNLRLIDGDGEPV